MIIHLSEYRKNCTEHVLNLVPFKLNILYVWPKPTSHNEMLHEMFAAKNSIEAAPIRQIDTH